MFFTYVLKSQDGSYYIGHTNDLDRRLREHNQGDSTYTAMNSGPWHIIYKKEFLTRGDAMKHENLLKRQKGGDGFYSIINDDAEKNS